MQSFTAFPKGSPITSPSSSSPPPRQEGRTDSLQKFKKAVDRLETQVQQFNYSDLRAVLHEYPSDSSKYYGASDSAIKMLREMFTRTFFFSKNEALRSELTNLSSSSPDRDAVWLKLANTLLEFRNSIEASELSYHRKAYDMDLGTLRKDSSWIGCFHFIIEKYLEETPTISKLEYGDFMRNLQKLCLSTYHWVMKNRRELSPQFALFAPTQEAGKSSTTSAPAAKEKRRRSLMSLMAQVEAIEGEENRRIKDRKQDRELFPSKKRPPQGMDFMEPTLNPWHTTSPSEEGHSEFSKPPSLMASLLMDASSSTLSSALAPPLTEKRRLFRQQSYPTLLFSAAVDSEKEKPSATNVPKLDGIVSSKK